MCGISVILKSLHKHCSSSVVDKMNQEVHHRGPDGQKTRFISFHDRIIISHKPENENNWQVALGHTRLNILDLTENANQPMPYNNQKYWMVYNGEIYNYIEIRNELKKKGYSFTSTGDSEVVLAAYAEWKEKCFERFRGMWAIVIIDLEADNAIFSRDRMGIKPLYFYSEGELFSLASEIKQFTCLSGFKATGSKNAACNYLYSGFEDLTQTFFQEVSPVPPGTWGKYDIRKMHFSGFHSYWDPGKIDSRINSKLEAGELFKEKFQESVAIHLRSDVPIGCELSGGMDSSSIITLMDKLYKSENDILSFSTTFPGFKYDEKVFIDKVLNVTGAKGHFDSPGPNDFIDDLDDFIYKHDEPVGSLTMYANYSLSKLIKKNNIKVVLNGQGGDELLGGYWQSYFAYLFSNAKRGKFGPAIFNLIGSLGANGNNHLVKQIPQIFKRYRARTNGTSDLKLTFEIDKELPVKNYLQLNEQERRIYDIRNLILPRLLKWDDRNLMAFSVEGRYPLLDHELIEL